MCLAVIDKDYSRKPRGERWAWKFISHDNFSMHNPDYQFVEDQWLKADHARIEGESVIALMELALLGLLEVEDVWERRPFYVSGFHVYTTSNDALDANYFRSGKLVKVKVRLIRLQGRECVSEVPFLTKKRMVKVLVADELFLPKPRTKREKRENHKDLNTYVSYSD